jgi:NAD(P)-dependent dehydrogenase (short-subunit alcohol dehydrogenase family)
MQTAFSSLDKHLDLSQQVILLTGATGALGQPLTEALLQAGASVIALSKTWKKLEQLFDNSAYSERLWLYALDYRGATVDDYATLASQISQHFGQLHALIHASGQLGYLTPLRYQKPIDFATLLHVNATAPWLLTQALLPLLLAKSGKIIFTINQEAKAAYWGAYGIAQAMLKDMAEKFSQEHPDLSVKSLSLPPFQSPLRFAAYPAEVPADLADKKSLIKAYLEYLL